ncbi:MAG: SMC family ATPase, partial [Phormidesmis sp.]
MQILSVALTNFKTHKDKQFDFQLGTNAICGENGAGKTSILEAIAWVLFNYQGSYRKEDLIRNGASSAQARVAFVSSRDSRTYEVQRSTSQGYTIFDPQLNERLPYTRTKDEVLPWLRQHLGVGPGTDLSQLFANTIGVPQGTFTVDFLLPTEKRKPIFDTILKVEEYRETYRQSNSLRKYSEAQSQRLKDLIEQYEDSLQSWDELQTNCQQLQAEIMAAEAQLKALEQQSAQLTRQRQTLKAQAEQIQAAREQQQTLTNQIEAQQTVQKRASADLVKAQQSADICKDQQQAYERFLATEAQIKMLNERGQSRQKILRQQQQSQQSLAKSQGELSRSEAKLEQFESAEKELIGLEAAASNQAQLEATRAALQQKAQSFTNTRFQQKNLTTQARAIAQEIAQIEAELKRLASLEATTEQIPQWEAQQSRVRQQLGRVEAAQQFEKELKALAETGQQQQEEYRQQVAVAMGELETWVSQFSELSEAAIAPVKTALSQGDVLSQKTLSGIKSILGDLSAQIDKQQLKQQQRELQTQLQRAYAQKAEMMSIRSQQAKQDQLTQQQQQISYNLAELGQALAAEPETTQALSQVEQQIEALDNPKGKQQLLQKT